MVCWERTSWRERGIWLKAAGDEECPILEEYGQELPQSMKKRKWIVEQFCQNGCNLFARCPYGRQMDEELREAELINEEEESEPEKS